MNITERYYILKPNYKDEQFIDAAMVPNATAEFQPIGYGEIKGYQPLEFVNCDAEEFRNKRYREIIRDILPANTSFIVKNGVKQAWEPNNIEGVQFYPAIYRDINSNIHDFWYLNIINEIDCWCREQSTYDRDEYEQEKDDEYYLGADIDQYVLDDKLLLSLTEAKRKIFRMGATSANDIIIHADILKSIAHLDLYGIQYFKLSEYTRGMEF
ncbi:MAG: hypothetical protein R3208_15610 [Ketobacteraceae bacterium]|nr:hypothetical protein [Ketobacteraceae bacterium]